MVESRSPSRRKLLIALAERIHAVESRGRGAVGAGDGSVWGEREEVARGFGGEAEGSPAGAGRSADAVGSGCADGRSVDAGWYRLPRGVVHEWFAGGDPPSDHPPLTVFCDLAYRALTRGPDSGGLVCWVGRSCWPYPRAMVFDACPRGWPPPGDSLGSSELAGLTGLKVSARFGADRRLLESSVMIDPGRGDRLWAMDLMARSPAVSAVVADGSGLDMAGSRRLQLAAEAGRALVLLARPLRELSNPSVAAYRWSIEPAAPTDTPADPLRGGPLHPYTHHPVNPPIPDQPVPRWVVRLLRRKDARGINPFGSGDAGRQPDAWRLEWQDDAGLVYQPAELEHRPAKARRRAG